MENLKESGKNTVDSEELTKLVTQAYNLAHIFSQRLTETPIDVIKSFKKTLNEEKTRNDKKGKIDHFLDDPDLFEDPYNLLLLDIGRRKDAILKLLSPQIPAFLPSPALPEQNNIHPFSSQRILDEALARVLVSLFVFEDSSKSQSGESINQELIREIVDTINTIYASLELALKPHERENFNRNRKSIKR